jgi:hypothetical protein
MPSNDSAGRGAIRCRSCLANVRNFCVREAAGEIEMAFWTLRVRYSKRHIQRLLEIELPAARLCIRKALRVERGPELGQ